MKKAIGKKTKNNLTIVKIIIYIWLMYICYLFIRSFAEVQLLKHYGICKKGIITDVRLTNRYANPSFMYKFEYKGETYKWPALTDDEKQIGDSICIVFLESYPSIQRPLNYFDYGDTKCNCK
jgi:hypothetical protein